MTGTGDEGRRPQPALPSQEAEDEASTAVAATSPHRLSPGRLQPGPMMQPAPRPQLPQQLAPMGQGRVPQLAQAFDVSPGEEAAPPLSAEASGSSSAVGTDATVPAYTVVRALRIGGPNTSGNGAASASSGMPSPRSPIGAPWRVPAPLLPAGDGSAVGPRSGGGLSPRTSTGQQSPRTAGSGAVTTPRSPAAQCASPRPPIFAAQQPRTGPPASSVRGASARSTRGGIPSYAFGSRILARPASGASGGGSSSGGDGVAPSPPTTSSRSTGDGSTEKKR
jgi:hypothetical protein